MPGFEQAARLTGTLRAFHPTLGDGGVDMQQCLVARDRMLAQRKARERRDQEKKSREQLTLSSSTSESLSSLHWGYFATNVSDAEEGEARKMRATFRKFLNVVGDELGDSSSDDIHSACAIVYRITRSTRRTDEQKRKRLLPLFGAISDKNWAEMNRLCAELRQWRTQHVPEEQEEKEDEGAEDDGSEEEEEKTDRSLPRTDRGFGASIKVSFRPPTVFLEASRQGMAAGIRVSKGGKVLGIDELKGNKSVAERAMEEGPPAGSEDNPFWWVDAVAKKEKTGARWLLTQCDRYLQCSPCEGVSAVELVQNIMSVVQRSNTPAALQSSLIDLLGIESFEFVGLIISRQADLLSLAVAINEMQNSDLMSGDTRGVGRPTFGCQVVIRSEEDKRLEKLRRKRKKKGQKGGGGGGGTGFDTLAFREELADAEQHYAASLAPKGSTGMGGTRSKGAAPPGSTRKTHFNPANGYGYEEITVPYQLPPEWKEEEKLVPVSSMPQFAREGFRGIKSLNRIQSQVYERALFSNENLLICAPTGAGKTNCAMLSVLHEVGEHLNDDGTVRVENFKIVYVAPMKALAQEMCEKFAQRLGSLGIHVREYTGDMQLTKKELAETQIIVTTPEKWDVTTRKANDGTLVQTVRLLIFDEVHLLHEDRGPVIEAIIARTLRQVESTQSMVRIVGLSATLPNFKDVAEFLRVNMESGLFYFPASFRPVPLEQTYIGVKGSNYASVKGQMAEITFKKARDSIRQGNQVMVFVHSRKDTFKTAEALREMAQAKGVTDLFAPDGDGEILKASRGSRNAQLKLILPYGFGMHHAGMLRSDRNIVERLFKGGHIKVLVCTATLAWGVNLPAHTVIIKGTQLYDSKHGTFVDLGMLDVMQIFGRAGRPQFDTSGEGIIITEHSKLDHYLRMVTNQLPIESKFIQRMSDNLNAEISLGTVTNVAEAVAWLSYTYLMVRMRKNPLNYGITYREYEMDPNLIRKRRELIESAARALDRSRMIRFDARSGTLSSTDNGRVAANYYIQHETMEMFNEKLLVNDSLDEADILSAVCQAHEFENVQVREDEMEELERILKQYCEIKVRGGVENKYGKVNILFQAYLSNVQLRSFSLISDTAYVVQNIGRILRGVFEIVLKKGFCTMARTVLTLCKMTDKRLWESQHPLRQFSHIPFHAIRKLEDRHVSIDQLLDMEVGEISSIVRVPQIGRDIARAVRQIPYLELYPRVQPITRTVLRVQLAIEPAFEWNDRVHGSVEPWWIWVEDTENEHIYHVEYFLLHKKNLKEPQELCFTIPVFEPLPPQYFVRAISDRWLWAESEVAMEFRHLLLPEHHSPHTELLDLQPLPRAALRDTKAEKLFSFTHFNPIQTQVYHTMRHTDHNVLLGAPTGSGKTVAAELAMFRLFEEYPDQKVIYIGPLKALVRERMKDWRKKFVKGYGKRMVELTGDYTPDIQALKSAHIVTTTPEKWDGISRSWQQRSYVKKAGLIIIDEIHLLGQDRGPIVEVIVSRMRYISTQTSQPIRIVGLSTALANAHDLGDWLGIPKQGLFNFKPFVRPVPLEIHIQGYEGKHYCPRMATMNKPTYQAIVSHSPFKPALVFVSSRRQTRLTALDLISFCVRDENPHRFRRMTESEMETVQTRVKDSNLRHTLSFGIGLHHAGLAEGDREVVESLFAANKIQILVSTSTLAWGVNLPAHLVVIKGTEYFDGKTNRYVDFPITDVLQMMGRAGRPQFDDSGVAVIMVHEPKKNFYKKFLYEPFPVESSLLEVLHDHINAEVVSGTIQNKQDAVDYLTWTYFYRRLLVNPSYYGLEAIGDGAVNAFLSERVDEVFQDLQEAECVEVRDDTGEVIPDVLGRIASYYYLSHQTAEIFARKIGDDNTVESLLEVLCSTAEYDELPVRHNEDLLNEELAKDVRIKPLPFSYGDPHTKASLLLQAHFSHLILPISDYVTDTKSVLDQAIRILQAMVDVAADGGWLFTTLKTMQLMQMVVQAQWYDDSSLAMLPHMSVPLLEELKKHEIECIPQLMAANRGLVSRALGKYLTRHRTDDVFKAMGKIPMMKMTLTVPEKVFVDEEVEIGVHIRRLHAKFVPKSVYCPRYPKHMDESWWLVVGDPAEEELLALRRVNIRSELKTNLKFLAPEDEQQCKYWVYLVCGTYIGIDQQQPAFFEASYV